MFRRRGPWIAGLVLALAAGGCFDGSSGKGDSLSLLAGAGMRPALDELIPAFAVATGCLVRPEYAGSGLLLARAEQPGVADLFLPGDASYLAELQRQTKRVAERANLAYLLPCIVVARGNPKKIASVADLAQPGVRVALGNPEACQVGRAADTLLRKAGIDPAAIDPKYGLTVSEVGLWVKVGDVDAAIVWDATAVDLGGAVEVVAVPVDSALVSRVDIAMLTDARNPEVARQFIEFCTGPRARGILRRKGYRVDAPLELETPAAPQGGSE